MTALWRRRLFLVAPPLAALVLVSVTPSDDGPTVCPFAICTGMACPGCGMTRAVSALLRGDLGLALTYHPLVPLVVAQIAIAWAWYWLRQRGKVEAPRVGLVNAVLISNGIALVGVWVFRLANGTLPAV